MVAGPQTTCLMSALGIESLVGMGIFSAQPRSVCLNRWEKERFSPQVHQFSNLEEDEVELCERKRHQKWTGQRKEAEGDLQSDERSVGIAELMRRNEQRRGRKRRRRMVRKEFAKKKRRITQNNG